MKSILVITGLSAAVTGAVTANLIVAGIGTFILFAGLCQGQGSSGN